MSEIIHIREPFYKAGKRFDWPGNPVGLGIANHYFYDIKGIIKVRVGGDPKILTITNRRARELCRKYNSYFRKKKPMLWVIPLQEFNDPTVPQKRISQYLGGLTG